ncbi:coatomer subunit beta'-2-like [Arachis stenosperma]|uniref:coatomer subunit beta'-2-like n=1 Tax=Arachis stenosperma TaxID=217475 RepID=UPI0025AB5E37|nr:coatomer subunit beta'-2-like [Arachis stenosperma]
MATVLGFKIVSASDDNVLKLWDWKKGWACLKTFQGHSHYVMSVAFNPKDPSTFATASLDGTLKIWSVDSSAPIVTLDGHLKGVNCANYFISHDKEYLISGSDDYTGHGNNVIAVCSHSELPIIITASEDSTVKIWDNVTYRLQNTLKFEMLPSGKDRAASRDADAALVFGRSSSSSSGRRRSCSLELVFKHDKMQN